VSRLKVSKLRFPVRKGRTGSFVVDVGVRFVPARVGRRSPDSTAFLLFVPSYWFTCARANTRNAGTARTPTAGDRGCETERRPWEYQILLSFAYLMFSAVLSMLVRRRQPEFAKDLELIVLRHQLSVLSRQHRRPKFRPADRHSSLRLLDCYRTGAGAD
jgi:hypothetical protein